MAKELLPKGDEATPHRGRIQAQGGGTEKSIAWEQLVAPTATEMLAKCNELENELTTREKKDREECLAKLRRFITTASERGGIDARCSKTWLKRGSKDIRIDLEVITGRAAVPPPEMVKTE